MLRFSVGTRSNQLSRFTRMRKIRKLTILGIETSCDDTCAAVVKNKQILSETKETISFTEQGGIVPVLAAKNHDKAISHVVNEAMEKSNLRFDELDLIAITRGPGISICLDVGIKKSMEIAREWKIPLVPVNHMEGHSLVIRMERDIEFPYLCVLISGGHSDIVVCHGPGEYTMIGRASDDAVGEVYDKVARFLNIPYGIGGGGKIVDKLAREATNKNKYSFKPPMKHVPDCNFSFTGIKSQVKILIDNNPEILDDEEDIKNVAAAFQQCVIVHIQDRLNRALKWCRKNVPGMHNIVVSGGVACNDAICAAIAFSGKKYHLHTIAPSKELCRDNAVMIAWAGYENYRYKKHQYSYDTEIYYDTKFKLDQTDRILFESPKRQWEESLSKKSLIMIEEVFSQMENSQFESRKFFNAISAAIKQEKFKEAEDILEYSKAKNTEEKFEKKFLGLERELKGKLQSIKLNQ